MAVLLYAPSLFGCTSCRWLAARILAYGSLPASLDRPSITSLAGAVARVPCVVA